jgi:hypothetical protein
MRTVYESPDHLVIEDRPWLWAVILWLMGIAALWNVLTGQLAGALESLLVLALGTGTIWIAWGFFPYQRFTFDRTTNTFTRRIARVNGAADLTLPITRIRCAATQADWSDGARLERLVLLTAGGPYPLEYGFGSVPRELVADTINDWLSGDD